MKPHSLALTSLRSRNPAHQGALGVLPGALAVGEAAWPRFQKTRWGWQRGGEGTDARGAEASGRAAGRHSAALPAAPLERARAAGRELGRPDRGFPERGAGALALRTYCSRSVCNLAGWGSVHGAKVENPG